MKKNWQNLLPDLESGEHFPDMFIIWPVVYAEIVYLNSGFLPKNPHERRFFWRRCRVRM
jgi:hypothetical protein